MRAKIKANYHWMIAAVAVTAMFVCGGIGNSLNSVLLIPVTESLGISRGAFSTVMVALNLTSVVLNLFSGILLLKLGYRKLISGAMVIATMGALLASVSNSLPLLCVASVLTGMYALCTGAGNPRMLGNWFHRHYGLVTGVVTAMTGLGGSVFTLVFSDLTNQFSWRSAYLAVAVVFLLLAVLIAVLVRNKPEEMGLKPYGEGYIPQNTKRESDDHWEGFSFEKLKKRPVFYIMIIATVLSCVCAYMALPVVNAHVQDCGLGADFAAKVQSVVMFALTITKLGFGYLSDKFGVKPMTMLSLAALTVALLLMAGIKDTTSAYVAALIFSVGLPICGIMPTLLVPSLFGYHASVQVMGIIQAMISVGNMVATPLTNSLRDVLGSYRPVFQGTALVSVAVMALYLVLFSQAKKDRRAFEKMEKEQIQGR